MSPQESCQRNLPFGQRNFLVFCGNQPHGQDGAIVVVAAAVAVVVAVVVVLELVIPGAIQINNKMSCEMRKSYTPVGSARQQPISPKDG
jgi:hypothetical protein